MITVRETKDADFLAGLNEEVQNLHHEMYPEIFRPYDREEIAKAFKKMLSGREAKAFVAYVGEEPAGYSLIFISRFNRNAFQHARSAMQVDQFATLKRFRKKGVGKKLMEFLVTLAQGEKLNRIDLNHWEKNEDARIFFGKAGFTYYNSRMYREV